MFQCAHGAASEVRALCAGKGRARALGVGCTRELAGKREDEARKGGEVILVSRTKWGLIAKYAH